MSNTGMATVKPFALTLGWHYEHRRPMSTTFLSRFAAGLGISAALLVASPASAVVVEKVVAVIGDHAILLSDLHQRARPYRVQLNARCPIGTAPCIPAENKILQQLLDRMVEEELEIQAAKRANITVSSNDIDATLERIAQANGMTLSQLINDVTQQSGMTEAEYRLEIRRQVIEGKLLQRVIQNTMRITRQELEEMFQRVVERERQILLYQPSWIVLQVGSSATAETIAARNQLANDIVRKARAGADFGDLARQYSEDAKTREDGGDLGIRAPAPSSHAQKGEYKMLAEPLEKVALGLDQGDVSEPFRFKDAVVIIKLVNRQPSRYTSFEAAQPEIVQRVQGEKLEKAKQKWLKDLRRRTHVVVRFL
jgi:peptidyl-prolyl cis-trans isomerase SurA